MGGRNLCQNYCHYIHSQNIVVLLSRQRHRCGQWCRQKDKIQESTRKSRNHIPCSHWGKCPIPMCPSSHWRGIPCRAWRRTILDPKRSRGTKARGRQSFRWGFYFSCLLFYCPCILDDGWFNNDLFTAPTEQSFLSEQILFRCCKVMW